MFTLGQWKNFDELEDNLSLDELYEVAGVMHDQEYNQQKFAASLKGIDLDEEVAKSGAEKEGTRSYEMIKKRAQAKIRGASEEELENMELAEMGLKPEQIE